MKKTTQTFEAYVMFCGAEMVPEQENLTRQMCIDTAQEVSENFEVDLILHIQSDNYPHEFVTTDVTDEILEKPFNANIDGTHPDDIYKGYKGRFGELVDDYIEQHEDTQRGRYTDRKIEEMRGKND